MKRKHLFLCLAPLALLGLGGCTDQSLNSAPPPGSEPGPALWQVADADTTIYLFGTVHALPLGIEWYDGRVERAFTSSSELVTEIDLSEAAASGVALAGAAMLPAGETLRSLMTDDDRKEYEAALISLGMPVEALDPFEPWFAAITLSIQPLVQDGYDPDSGVETRLNALSDGKDHAALETIEEQIELFDGLPLEAQLRFLDETVEAVPQASASLSAMVAEWLEGDADELAHMLNAELTDPALYERLLTARNAHWSEWIEQRMDRPGTVFVAVGAGHLAGKGSVQDQLRRRGLEVRRIWE